MINREQNMAEFGDLIRKKRRGFGMTQAELAERVGVTDGYIGKIEIGYQVPGLKTLSKIAVALKMPLDELLPQNKFYPDIAILSKRLGEYDEQFKKQRPTVKKLLLEIAPIIEKYF